MIRAYTNQKQTNWDQGLAQLPYNIAYNSSVHETTGYTPFEIMFGRRARIPIDLIYPNANQHIRKSTSQCKLISSRTNPADAEEPLKNKQIDVMSDVDDDEINKKTTCDSN
jgi:hypothetical protein